MTFAHFGFGKESIHRAADLAIESHGKPEHLLTSEERTMRDAEHTGIELSAAELAVVRKVVSDWMESTNGKIAALERQIGEGSAANVGQANEELASLSQTRKFLEHNLAEKLFDGGDKPTIH